MSLAISILRRAESKGASIRSSFGSLGGRRLAVLGGFVLVTIAGGLLALSRSPLFGVRTVEVLGADPLPTARVRALADVARGADLLWLDLPAIEARIETDPWVERATLTRGLPWTLRVTIRERRPVAVLRTAAGSDGLVAADGTLLGRARPNADLPRLVFPAAQLGRGEATSENVSALARVVRWLPSDVRPDVETLGFMQDGSILLSVRGGPRVRFGAAEDLRAKGRSLRRVLGWARHQDVAVDEISLVSPGAPAVSLSA
jgi:cell division protein FtsQ